MRKAPVIRKYKTSKQMEKMIKKTERELNQEADRQLDIANCSMIITLYRYWNFKTERISKILNVQQSVWNDCGADNNMSMLRMCDEECDIELTNHEGVSYRDVIWLNAEIDEGKPLNDAQWLIMRQNQKKWVKAQMMACVCLSMHRAEGWGFKRLQVDKLKSELSEILEGYEKKEPIKLHVSTRWKTDDDFMVRELKRAMEEAPKFVRPLEHPIRKYKVVAKDTLGLKDHYVYADDVSEDENGYHFWIEDRKVGHFANAVAYYEVREEAN